MNKPLAFAAFILFLASVALPLSADVTPTDVKAAATKAKDAGNQGAKKIRKKKDAKKSSLMDELHKDRSLPAGDKVPMTDDKPRPHKSLSEELHKDRS